jgi:hypothetical protein
MPEYKCLTCLSARFRNAAAQVVKIGTKPQTVWLWAVAVGILEAFAWENKVRMREFLRGKNILLKKSC